MLVEKYNNFNVLDKYFETKTLQRLKGKGLFCGMIMLKLIVWYLLNIILDMIILKMLLILLGEIESLYNMLTYFENLNGMCFDTSNERLRNFNGEIVLSENFGAEYEIFLKLLTFIANYYLRKKIVI